MVRRAESKLVPANTRVSGKVRVAAPTGLNPSTFWRYRLTKNSTAKSAKKLMSTVTTPRVTDRSRNSRGGTSGTSILSSSSPKTTSSPRPPTISPITLVSPQPQV